MTTNLNSFANSISTDLNNETPLDGHVLTSSNYLYNCFATKATPETIRSLYFKLSAALATLPNSKIKPEISFILKSIISDEQLKTYESLLLQETLFRELVNELKLVGLINVIVRNFEITGTVKTKDFLKLCEIVESNNLTTVDIQMNKEKSEIFIKLAKIQTSSQK